MSKHREVEGLRWLCSTGVDLLTQMPLASEALHRLFPSFSLSMIRVDASCAPQEHYSEHFDEFSHHLFASAGHVFSARTADPAAFSNLLAAPQPVGNLVDTPADYVAGATYQHLFKRNGIHHCLDLALREGDRPLGILGIFREADAPPFDARDVELARAVYPSLVHALSLPRGGAAFDERDGAMLVARSDGAIEWASPQALRWLEDAAAGPERASLMDSEQLPRFCRELFVRVSDAARARRSGSDEVPLLTLPVAGGRLRLRAWPLDGLAGPGQRIGVQLSYELNRALCVVRVLESSELPRHLRQLALRLWEGKTLADVARELKLSPATLKSYRKELYARLEVHGVDELCGLLEASAREVTLDLARHQPGPPSGG